MERPLTPLLCATIAGIVIGHVCHVADSLLVALLFLSLIILLAAAIVKSEKLTAALVALCLCLLGILNVNVYLYNEPSSSHISNYVGKGSVMLEGIICETPETSPDRTELIVSALRIIDSGCEATVNGLVLLNIDGRHELKYGDAIRVRTRLKTPHNFQNPGGFDYAKYLRYKGIAVRGFVKNQASVVIMREGQGNAFKIRLERFRTSVKKFIMENSGSPEGEIIQAMILGDQKEIPRNVMENFNRTGTTHIIAISGFNIGIIAFLSFFVIRLFMKSSTYILLRFNIVKVSTVFAIVPVILYTFIAGMGISVVRAAIMALTFMIAVIFSKERDLYNSLLLAALVILIASPPSLFDVSFQLSFMAVWAILFITPRLLALFPERANEGINGHRRWGMKIYRDTVIFIIVSLSATLGTLPLIVYYFNRVSTVVLLSNLFVVPVLGIIAIPVCTAIIIALPLSQGLALFFLYISSLLVKFSISMVDLFASFPGSNFFLGTPSLVEISAYYLLLVTAVKLTEKFRKNEKGAACEMSSRTFFRLSAALLALVFFFVGDALYLYSKDRGDGTMTVTAIDVGQGSSTLIRLPHGRNLLVDGGGMYDNKFDIGRYVVAPYLWHERIRRIDIVVLTHPHPDHLNGLIYILGNFDVKEVWTNGETADSDVFREFMRIVSDKGITHKLVSETSPVVTIDGVAITVLNPKDAVLAADDAPRHFQDSNNDAIVLRLMMGSVGIVLPADISEPTEMRIVKEHRDVKGQVLFVPHHGGFTSSTATFLDTVEPDIAVISCGRDNVYNDPHPRAIERYLFRGIKVLRTDLHGAVTIRTDGSTISYDVFEEN